MVNRGDQELMVVTTAVHLKKLKENWIKVNKRLGDASL